MGLRQTRIASSTLPETSDSCVSGYDDKQREIASQFGTIDAV